MAQFEQIESLFHEARSLAPEVDRAAWLEARCQHDARLLAEVRSLLEAYSEMQDSPAIAPAVEPGVPTAQFGAYRATRLLGRGGMSMVYLAERADGQFEQTVALKIMASYLAGPEFLRRFQTERQLLASLNHHNVTRLLDGGVSSAGDPYLITEYVEGETIDRYCDQRNLSVEARLRIFLQVAEAVDYAHRNLIVHRDLKPGNILVTGDGVVKLLDFGTASLTAQQGDATITRARMLTPRYASPEQLRGERANISNDIFALGVILFELLTGAWPFGNPDSILSELERATQDVAPTRPATAVTEQAAVRRGLPVDRLRRLLEGDLSAITFKALENDPARRYGSVRQFAEDVERFLNGLPVQARPQTAFYRAGKFLRRRWVPVTAAVVFIAGLLASTLVAVQRARVAQAEALKAQRVNQFLNDMLASAGDYGFDPKQFTVAQMLEASEPRLAKGWNADPLTEATLRRSLGASYVALQRIDQAKGHLEKALVTFRALGEEKEVVETLCLLAENADNAGRPEEGLRFFQQALEHVNRLGGHAPARLVFHAKSGLATELGVNLKTDFEQARKLFVESIAIASHEPSIPRTRLAVALSMQSAMLMDENKNAEADAGFHKALETGREEDPGGSWETFPLYELMILNARIPNFAAAMEYARERYGVLLRHEGPDHVDTIGAKMLCARYQAETGQTQEAAAQVLEAMPALRKGYPAGSFNLWSPLTTVAHVLDLAGRFAQGEQYARESLAVVDGAHLPEADGRRAESLLELGRALRGEGKNREAVSTLERALAVYEQLGPSRAKSAERVRKMLSETRALL